jgi:plastocyanin
MMHMMFSQSNTVKALILLFLLIFWGHSILGCAAHLPHHTIAILDQPAPPNLSITPAEITIKAGEVVAWSNHTDSVLELSVWMGDGQLKPGLLKRLGSKVGLGSKDNENADPTQADSEKRMKALEESLRSQQLELKEIKAQLNLAPEQSQVLEEKLQALEQRLQEQEAQLADLKAGSTFLPESQKSFQAPAFIHSFATVRVKFDKPGQYTFSLFQSSPNRRSAQVEGRLTVLP